MSALKDLFESTNRTRPVDARVIPDQSVNFFDRENKLQIGFKTKITNMSSIGHTAAGLPTLFTDTAMDEFESDQYPAFKIPPQGFVVPSIGFTGLHRWVPKNKYWEIGSAINP